MTRIRQIEVDDARIKGLAESHTGRTTWWFTVDFNNWGHVTGTRWTWSQKADSKLAEKYGDCVAEEIKSLLKKRNVTIEDYSELIDADKDFGTIKGLNYIKKLSVNKKVKITTDKDSVNFIHEHVYSVIAHLKHRGFCNIKSIKISNCTDFAGCVSSVSINGIKSFNKNDTFYTFDEVVIEYNKEKRNKSSMDNLSLDWGLIAMFLFLIVCMCLMLLLSRILSGI